MHTISFKKNIFYARCIARPQQRKSTIRSELDAQHCGTNERNWIELTCAVVKMQSKNHRLRWSHWADRMCTLYAQRRSLITHFHWLLAGTTPGIVRWSIRLMVWFEFIEIICKSIALTVYAHYAESFLRWCMVAAGLVTQSVSCTLHSMS